MRMLLIAAATAALLSPGLGRADVEWRQDAAGVLRLQEHITRGQDGLYTYRYTFANLSEAKPIWWIVLYTNAEPRLPIRPLRDAQHPGWSANAGLNNAGNPVFLQGWSHLVYTWAPNWPDEVPSAVRAGETLGGFSYRSTLLDDSVKRFVADRQGEYSTPTTPGGQMSFSYGGHTVSAVPEPAGAALLLAGLGAVGWVARRRRR